MKFYKSEKEAKKTMARDFFTALIIFTVPASFLFGVFVGAADGWPAGIVAGVGIATFVGGLGYLIGRPLR